MAVSSKSSDKKSDHCSDSDSEDSPPLGLFWGDWFSFFTEPEPVYL